MLKKKLKDLNDKLDVKRQNKQDNMVLSPKEFNSGRNYNTNYDSKKSSCEIKYANRLNKQNLNSPKSP